MQYQIVGITHVEKGRLGKRLPVNFDPGIKHLCKNGSIAVFVDQTVWQTQESAQALKDKLFATEQAATTQRREHAKTTMALGNKTSAYLTEVAKNDTLTDQLDNLKSWLIFCGAMIGGLGIWAAVATWVR